MNDLTRSEVGVSSTDIQVSTERPRQMNPVMRLLISSAVILGLWQMVVVIFEMPSFILPAPAEVFIKLIERYDVLLKHTWVTAQEILLGLLLGLSMGLFFALQMLMFEPL